MKRNFVSSGKLYCFFTGVGVLVIRCLDCYCFVFCFVLGSALEGRGQGFSDDSTKVIV